MHLLCKLQLLSELAFKSLCANSQCNSKAHDQSSQHSQVHLRGLRQKRQSLDLDDLLENSPSWPPISSPGQSNMDYDRELSSGEWVDKLMVNKLDPICGLDNNPMASWDPSNGNMSDAIYQKYLSDPSKSYSEKSFGFFPTNNQFNVNASDDVDELDTGTSDSSEPDFLWQYNQSKLGSFCNGASPNAQKPNHKHTKNQESRYSPLYYILKCTLSFLKLQCTFIL